MSASGQALKLFKPLCLPLPQKKMMLADYFKAINAGDLPRVQQWFLDRRFILPCIEESAWDLACRQNYPDIARLIQERMEQDSATRNALFNKRDEQQGPYKRTWLPFDNTHFFRYLLFETSKKGYFYLQTGYKTQLEAPYVQKALHGLGGTAFSDRAYFYWFRNEWSEEDIRQQVTQIINNLVALNKKDGTEITPISVQPVFDAMETGFIDAQRGFPPHNELLVSHWRRIPNTYEGYEMYEAAAHADYERMLGLLRAGADPNAHFSSTPTLHTAAHLGTQYVFNQFSPFTESIRYDNLLRTIKLLLDYGADPSAQDHDETLMEFLVRYSQFVKPEVQAMYLVIIDLLTVHKNARKHILVHPDVSESPLSKRVLLANDEMDKRARSNPCVKSVRTGGERLGLIMLDGELLEIESRNIADLNATEYETLFQYFNAQASLNMEQSVNKRDYFDALMRIHSGTGYVEMIWHKGRLKGYVVSNVIPTATFQQATTIYYAKLALAQLPPAYAGLMKAMLFMRGFSNNQHKPEQQIVTFYEAASARGFGLSDIIKRFPALPVLKESMPEILRLVYEGSMPEIESRQGVWYVKDALQVDEPLENTSKRWPTFSAVVRDNYQAVYQRPGWTVAMAFPNDEDNYTCFQEGLIPMIGEEAFNALQAFYRERHGLENECSASSLQNNMNY